MGRSLHADRINPWKMPVNLGDLASGATNTDQEIARFVANDYLKLEAAYGILIAALTGAATNYANFSIVNKGTAGAGTTEMAVLAFTSGIEAAAKAPAAFTLSGTAANLLVSPGEVIAINSTHQGTGAVYPAGNFSAHFTMQ